MNRPRHIGIVACSAEGAALCYRTICEEGASGFGANAHPEVSLHGASFAAYVDALERDDLDAVAALMLDSARKLAAAGADFLICPDNTIHQALPRVQPHSPLPWLHIAEVVAVEAEARGFHRLGLLGTRWLVASEVYPQALAARGLDWLRPADAQCVEVNRIIMDELVHGVFAPPSITYLESTIRGLGEHGCDAVVLGCTELPLVVDDRRSALPTLDSTRLLARAALRCAAAEPED